MTSNEEDLGLDLIPLSGINSDSPLSYLLDLQTNKILLDCGWAEDFNLEQLKPLLSTFSTTNVDLILITFPDMAHIGALPYLYKYLRQHFPNKRLPKILLSKAAAALCILNFYEVYLDKATNSNFSLFDLDDVDYLKQYFIEVNFAQPVPLSTLTQTSKETILTLHKAGRVLGGGM
eukprot:snap_masked-scaffold_2-processed-gene-24.19-mRNA-1 protein AED:1.00 eAED:1.00 QI:0/0/0/0/1/1/2/0/175